VDHWLSVASAVDGFRGFAIRAQHLGETAGRTIWPERYPSRNSCVGRRELRISRRLGTAEARYFLLEKPCVQVVWAAFWPEIVDNTAQSNSVLGWQSPTGREDPDGVG
jgi:hypothetical protein